LILADVDFGSMFETGGEGIRRFLSHFMEVWYARGADLEFGRKIADSMRSSGLFPAGVNVHRILMPLSGTGAGRRFGFPRKYCVLTGIPGLQMMPQMNWVLLSGNRG
jgi:hypothetical protein